VVLDPELDLCGRAEAVSVVLFAVAVVGGVGLKSLIILAAAAFGL
jgi:hypothetical protein